jgi:hypothetical protein
LLSRRCALSSVHGFLTGTWPLSVVERARGREVVRLLVEVLILKFAYKPLVA